jgi:dynactin complex subunit
MSNPFSTRLLLTFVNVRRRLESLLELCRIHEQPSWNSADEWKEFYRFSGPYRSDIDELECSIATVTQLIGNIQHELNATDEKKPIPNYPLCNNGWTIENIERLHDNMNDTQLTLDILALFRLQTLEESIRQWNENNCCSMEPTTNERNTSSVGDSTRISSR